MTEPTLPTDEPTGTCVLCWRRDPYHPAVCDACRNWLAGLIGDLRILHEQLATPVPVVRDVKEWPLVNAAGQRHLPDWAVRDDKLLQHRDPIGTSLPAAPLPGQPTGPRASSKPGSRPPIPLDPIDLAAPARPGSRAPHARAQLGLGDPAGRWQADDQTGHLSLATVLETWVRDWIGVRALGEYQPAPDVATLTRWLADRADWACDEHPAVDEFAAELRTYRSTMRGILGLTDLPTRKDAPCPKCDDRDLYVRNGSVWVECGSCGAMMSPAEYTAWVGEQVLDKAS